MNKLSLIVLMVAWSVFLLGQSPHGGDFVLNCADCHNPEGWSISSESWKTNNPSQPKSFSHSKTEFPLEGAHQVLDCKQCHTSLVFAQASSDCVSCHTDMHEQTVGDDCKRCHDSDSWTIDRIPELHERNGFPLIGAHDQLTCVECHQSASNLRFNRIGNECVNCHRQDYENTQNPDHSAAGYSDNCMECHNPSKGGWGVDNFNHGFFPLVGGHDISCEKCHTGGTFANLSADCVTCHQEDYNNTQSPNHTVLQFSIDCASCHTTAPEWTPANFPDHDGLYFPIYSGEHKGEWDQCIDCHTNPNNYAEFSCTNCHTNPETNDDHGGVNGYVYSNNACFACHPNGNEEDNFNHDGTNFPLKGGHVGVDCNSCHTNGFAGTPTDCNSCHNDDYLGTTNPNHAAANFPTDCAQCHNEGAWTPATFDHDAQFFPIYSGKHEGEWDQCVDCHTNPNDFSTFSCIDCHEHNNSADLADDHNGVSGYSYESTACYSCHPKGEE